MRKVINPADFGKIKRMNMNQLNDYILNIYLSGKEDMKDELLDDCDEAVILYDTDLRDLLLSVPNMTEEMTDQVMYKINNLEQ